MTLEALKRLDAGEWFGPKFQQVKVPTLDEIFSALGNRSRYLIDLRAREGGTAEGSLNEGLVARLADKVRHYGLHRKVSVSVDDAKLVHLVKRELPGVTVLAKVNAMFTISSLNSIMKIVDDSGADGVVAHFLNALLHSSLVVEAKRRGKKVFIYTVDSVYVSRWLECLGVDAILTNKPEKIVTASKCPVAGAYDP